MVKDINFYKSVKSFLEVYLVKQKKYSSNTKKAYKASIKLLLKYFKVTLGLTYGQISFDDLTYANITGFLSWLEETRKNSDSTINQRLMGIKAFAKYCSITDPSRIAFQLEIENVSPRKLPKKPVKFLDEEAVKTLLDQPDCTTPIGRRDRMIILLMYDLAARCQEIVDIKIGHIYFRRTGTTVLLRRKGNKMGRLSISPEVAGPLKNYIREFHPESTKSPRDPLFFTMAHGVCNTISVDAIALFLQKYAMKGHQVSETLPEHVTPHQIRHSRAMHLYRKGLPMVLLAEILGHTDIKTTKIYAYSDTDMKRDAMSKLPTPAAYEGEEATWVNEEELILKLYGLA